MKSATFFLFLAVLAHASVQGQALTVVVKGIKNDKGNVAAALYRSPDEFMKKTWQSRSADSSSGELKFIFETVPAGNYAISVMHDENKNGKVDTNMMGIPKEGFGFSNDAMGAFGPPEFDKAKFVIPDTQQVIITLKYY